jgi:transglutaminase-like putative cysteine protease
MPEEFFRYRIVHETSYLYSGRIDLCHSICCLCPRETPFQSRGSHSISVEPRPEVTAEHMDFFGNHLTNFSVQHSHEKLLVRSASEVRVSTRPRPWDAAFSDKAWEAVAAELPALKGDDAQNIGPFRLASPATPCPPRLREYALGSFPAGTGIFAGCRSLMERVHRDFRYAPGSTAVHTKIEEVFTGRQGVCQDFAHLLLAGLRSLGLAARYVSGYLETTPPPGKPRLQGADASHAWVEVYVPGLDWVPFDPTNNVCPGPRHIVAAIGRDYFDVQPLHGIFLGSGTQSLGVRVDVVRI